MKGPHTSLLVIISIKIKIYFAIAFYFYTIFSLFRSHSHYIDQFLKHICILHCLVKFSSNLQPAITQHVNLAYVRNFPIEPRLVRIFNTTELPLLKTKEMF